MEMTLDLGVRPARSETVLYIHSIVTRLKQNERESADSPIVEGLAIMLRARHETSIIKNVNLINYSKSGQIACEPQRHDEPAS